MARYLTVGNLLVEDVVTPDGARVLDRLGVDGLRSAARIHCSISRLAM